MPSKCGASSEGEFILQHALQDSVESAGADNSGSIVPSGDWKKGVNARIKYTHASCPGLTCSLTCTSLGPYVMVHGMSVCHCYFFL